MPTVVNKAPNKSAQFTWDYTLTDEAKISGFDVILETKGANTGDEKVVLSTIPSARMASGYLSPVLGGQYYYVVRAFFNDTSTGTPVKICSQSSNEVTINVVVLPVVTNVNVR